MKNMLKNKTSLIIVCVFIGILICHFTMCGCKSNYGLIEGLTPNAPAVPPTKMKPTATAATAAPAAAPAAAAVAAPAAAPAAALSPSSTLASGPANSTPASTAPASGSTKPNQLGDLMETAKAMMGAPSTGSTATGAKNEGFTPNSRPIGYGSLQESKNDDWNFSKWVKDAMRYAKGMGNENRLDSYQYNSGPPIPLPEGEMFFFKDTKFSTQCCPGTYSNSLGCACLSQLQFNYLMTRGGNNNVPTGRKTAYYNEY